MIMGETLWKSRGGSRGERIRREANLMKHSEQHVAECLVVWCAFEFGDGPGSLERNRFRILALEEILPVRIVPRDKLIESKCKGEHVRSHIEPRERNHQRQKEGSVGKWKELTEKRKQQTVCFGLFQEERRHWGEMATHIQKNER